MKARRLPLGARFGGWVFWLVLVLAACTDRELPTAVPALPDRPSMLANEGSRLVSVSAGGNHSCGLRSDGTVVCWGRNTRGQAPPVVAGTFIQVSAGWLHTCGVKADGVVTCWGAGETNTGSDFNVGQAIDPTGTFVQVSA